MHLDWPIWHATLYQTWHILWQASTSKSVWFDYVLGVITLYYSLYSGILISNVSPGLRNGIWNDPMGLVIISVYGSLYLNVQSFFFEFMSVSLAWYWWRLEGGRLHYKTHADTEYKHEKIVAASIPALLHYQVLQKTRIGPSQYTVCCVVCLWNYMMPHNVFRQIPICYERQNHWKFPLSHTTPFCFAFYTHPRGFALSDHEPWRRQLCFTHVHRPPPHHQPCVWHLSIIRHHTTNLVFDTCQSGFALFCHVSTNLELYTWGRLICAFFAFLRQIMGCASFSKLHLSRSILKSRN